jgi:hypothetical protein
MRNIVGGYHGSNGTRFWVTKIRAGGLKTNLHFELGLNWDREDVNYRSGLMNNLRVTNSL